MKRRGCSGCLLRVVLALFLLAAIAGGALIYFLSVPYRGFSQPVVLDIARGTGTSAIARELADAGVIRYPWELLAVRAGRPRARLQAGEYQFAQPASPWTVFDRLVRGDVFYYELTVPEGDNMFDIAASAGKLGFVKSADFLRVAKSPALIRDLAPAGSIARRLPVPLDLPDHPANHGRATGAHDDRSVPQGVARALAGREQGECKRDGDYGVADREGDRHSPRPAQGGFRVLEPAAARYATRLRSDGDLCGAARGALSRRDPPLGSGERKCVQHLPACGPASGSNCESGSRIRSRRRFIRRRPGTCISWRGRMVQAGTISLQRSPSTIEM